MVVTCWLKSAPPNQNFAILQQENESLREEPLESCGSDEVTAKHLSAEHQISQLYSVFHWTRKFSGDYDSVYVWGSAIFLISMPHHELATYLTHLQLRKYTRCLNTGYHKQSEFKCDDTTWPKCATYYLPPLPPLTGTHSFYFLCMARHTNTHLAYSIQQWSRPLLAAVGVSKNISDSFT